MAGACKLIWEAAGRPASERPVTDLDSPTCCAVCGTAITRGVHGKHAFGASFGAHGELLCQWSEYACEACNWAMSGKPPKTLRLWSVVYRTDMGAPPSNPKAPTISQYVHLTSKNDLAHVMRTLLDPPEGDWIVSVAQSGQKHVLPFASVNTGSGQWSVRFESLDVASSPAELARVLYSVACLLSAGFYRSEVLSGEPNSGRLVKLGIKFWRAHDAAITPYRTSPLLELAVFLCTKGATNACKEEAARALDRRGADRPRDTVCPVHVALSGSRGDRSEALVGAREDGAGDERVGGRELAADGQPSSGKAPDRGTTEGNSQLNLFSR